MNLRVLPSEKVQLYLLFYKPSCDDPFLNRLVAYFDAPFCHVEIAIPTRVGDDPWDRTMMASSIYQNQTVFFKPKTYDRHGYISFAIEISVAQLYKIKSFCKHHTERMTPFSLGAMYAAYLPLQLVETNATFCSKHVTQALQFAAVPLADNINPSLTTPSNLYKRLVSANGGAAAILQVIPSRMFKPKQEQQGGGRAAVDNNKNNNDTRYYYYEDDDNNNNEDDENDDHRRLLELKSSASYANKRGNNTIMYDTNNIIKLAEKLGGDWPRGCSSSLSVIDAAGDDNSMIFRIASGAKMPRCGTDDVDFFTGAKNVLKLERNTAARHQQRFFSIASSAAAAV